MTIQRFHGFAHFYREVMGGVGGVGVGGVGGVGVGGVIGLVVGVLIGGGGGGSGGGGGGGARLYFHAATLPHSRAYLDPALRRAPRTTYARTAHTPATTLNVLKRPPQQLSCC